MPSEVSRVDIWAGELEDRPGALASMLARLQMLAQIDLDFIIARLAHDKPGRGVVYLAPLAEPDQQRAATEAGLHRSQSIHAVRVVGPDRPGLAAGLAGTLAAGDLNLVGMSAAAKRGVAIVYLRFASKADAEAAVTLLAESLSEH